MSHTSPSPRRAWIEIFAGSNQCACTSSPSPRRAWIEMVCKGDEGRFWMVALPTEGVD